MTYALLTKRRRPHSANCKKLHRIAPRASSSCLVRILLRLVLLPTSHEGQEDVPPDANNTAKDHAMLNRNECQADETDQRPQFLSRRNERPEASLRRLPPELPTLPAKLRDAHDEQDCVDRCSDRLIEQELDGCVEDAELLLSFLGFGS